MLSTPAVSAGRSERSPSFQETEYEIEDDEEDEDGADDVIFRSFDRMPSRLVFPGQITASVADSRGVLSRPNWTEPSTLPAPFKASSRTGVPSTTPAKFARVLYELPSATHKTPAQTTEKSYKNTMPIVNKRKQPTGDECSEKRTTTGRASLSEGGSIMWCRKKMLTNERSGYVTLLLNALQVLAADRRNDIAASDRADPQRHRNSGMIRVL